MKYRKIYEERYGPIPKGHHIHHKDGNHSNNHIDNLQCVSAQEHFDIHFSQGDYGACWSMLRTGHIILNNQQKSQLSSKNAKAQWTNKREKMISSLKGRTWKLDPITAKKVGMSGYLFTSETANVCKETVWINNGSTNRRIKKNEEIPDGFTKGRLIVRK